MVREAAARFASGCVLCLCVLFAALGSRAETPYAGPLPDFINDRFNVVKDARSGSYLRPGLSGETFEWPTAAPVDWNNDGLFDLLVGYNLREPDVIRMVVYINQGEVGRPAFTGEPSPETCFYVTVLHRGAESEEIFQAQGYHHPHRSHKYAVFMPAVFDFDNDGRFDILVNEGVIDTDQHRGQWLLMNVGETAKPRFEAFYLHDDEDIDSLPPGPYTRAMALFRRPPGTTHFPTFSMLDWDSDGVLDIHYSNAATHVLYGELDAAGRWTARDGGWRAQKPSNAETFGDIPFIVTADFDADGSNELVVANARKLATKSSDGFLSLFVRDATTEVRYRLAIAELFSLNSDDNPLLYPDFRWPYLFAKHGWWYPRIAAVDFDEDGDPDILAGWGGGNDQRQVGDRMYLYRTPGGVPGSRPAYRR